MPRCVAVFCSNTGDAGFGMFSFPKDRDLKLIWRQNMKRKKSAREQDKLWESTVHSKLCGEHFEEWCFVKVGPERSKTLGWKPGKKTLVADAIPTMFKRSVKDAFPKPKGKRSAYEKRERREVSMLNFDEHFNTKHLSNIIWTGNWQWHASWDTWCVHIMVSSPPRVYISIYFVYRSTSSSGHMSQIYI